MLVLHTEEPFRRENGERNPSFPSDSRRAGARLVPGKPPAEGGPLENAINNLKVRLLWRLKLWIRKPWRTPAEFLGVFFSTSFLPFLFCPSLPNRELSPSQRCLTLPSSFRRPVLSRFEGSDSRGSLPGQRWLWALISLHHIWS